MSHLNLILPLSSLFYRDPDEKHVTVFFYLALFTDAAPEETRVPQYPINRVPAY